MGGVKLYLIAILTAAATLLVAGCSDDESTPATDADQPDETDSGDAQVEPDGDSDADGGEVGDTGDSGDAVADGDADQGIQGPEAYVYLACDEVDSTDIMPDGLYTFIDGGCVGDNPLESAGLLCDDAAVLADPGPVYSWSGSMVLSDGTYGRLGEIAGTGHVWFPADCVDDLGGGDCAGLEGLLAALATSAVVSCDVDATYGGCTCETSAVTTVADAGTFTASEGEIVVTYWRGDAAREETYAIADDGEGNYTILNDWDDALDIATIADHEGDASLCETYCIPFVAACNDAEAVTGYDDLADCLSTCDGFTTTGVTEPVTTGDSVECRIGHVRLAVDPSSGDNLTTHCRHAQETATAPCTD